MAVKHNSPVPSSAQSGTSPMPPMPPSQRARRPLPKPPSVPNSPGGAVAGPSTSTSRIPEAHTYYSDEKRRHVSSPSTDNRWLPPNAEGLIDSRQSLSDTTPYTMHTPYRSESISSLQRYATASNETSRREPSAYTSGNVYRPPGAAVPNPPSVPNEHYSQQYYYEPSPPHASPPNPRQASRDVSFGNGNGDYRTPEVGMPNGAYGASDSASLKAVKPMPRSTLDHLGNVEGIGYDVNSSSGSSFSQEDTVILSTSTATTVERGTSFSSSIYSPDSASPPRELHSRPSMTASSHAAETSYASYAGPSRPAEVSRTARHHEEMQRTIASIKAPLELQEDEDDDDFEDIDEDPDRFVILSLLSHLAVRLRDKVPRGTHVKGSIPYDRAFTGKDIVVSVIAAFGIVFI